MGDIITRSKTPTWHGPDLTCNFPQTVLRPIEPTSPRFTPNLPQTNWDSCQTEKPGLSGTENPDFTRPQSQKCQVGLGLHIKPNMGKGGVSALSGTWDKLSHVY